MKPLTLALALILSTLMSYSQTKDSDGHLLVSMWKNYYKAKDADKPQDQAAALEAIKAEARTKHYSWDFYDAARQYVSVKSSINWKDRSSLQDAFEREISACGDPVVVFYHNRSRWAVRKLIDYSEENKEVLLASHNPEFYGRDGRVTGSYVFSPLIPGSLANDYEYTLWSLLADTATDEIKAYYKDKYPYEALIECAFPSRYYYEKQYYDKLGDFAARYEGKAVSMIAREGRIKYELRQLDNSGKATAAQYKAIRETCAAFEKDRRKFSGKEKEIADCCTQAADIIKRLDCKSINAEIKDNILALQLRNISSLTVSLYESIKGEKGGKVYETKLDNPAGSYYVVDSLTHRLPDLADGSYKMECVSGTCTDEKDYDKYTLSIATHADAGGYAAYVAEYDTGKPVDVCALVLLDADLKPVAREDNVKMEGFTVLPEKFGSYFTSKYKEYFLRASCIDKDGRFRQSPNISLSSPNPGKPGQAYNYDTSHAVILTDRSAFNPDETVHWKAIIYKGTYEYSLVPEGSPVKAVLYDSQGKELASSEHLTNEFGSVDGSFPLSGGPRGGMFSIVIMAGGMRLDSHPLRVDEFVLPTFEVLWDEDTRMYFQGDELKCSGRIAAYSGHSLGGAKAFWDVLPAGMGGEVSVAPDGSFSFCIPTEKDAFRYGYPVTLKVMDSTGETLEFQTYKPVNRNIPLGLDLKNKAAGRYTSDVLRNYYRYEDWIVRDDAAEVEFSTAGLEREGLSIVYSLAREGGVVRTGKVQPGSTAAIDLKGLPSGMYTLTATASVMSPSGMLEKKVSKDFIKASDDDTALDMNVTSFFKELGDNEIALQIGCTAGPVWAVVELYGSGNVRIDQQIVTLRGERGKDGSLKTIRYDRRDDWPESLTLNVLYFLKGECYRYSRTVKLEIKAPVLPLSFTRFVDSTRPGQECSLIIQTEPGIECAATLYDKATEIIHSNRWFKVWPSRRPNPSVIYSEECGFNRSSMQIFYKAAGGTMATRAEAKALGSAMVLDEAVVDREAPSAANEEAETVAVRENFDATMAWEPALRSDADGRIELKFKGSDRLSTYYVQLFAHGEGMKNAVLCKEMQVTIPVKLSLAEPLFLYEGDKYVARMSLASTMEQPLDGKLTLRFYDGGDYKAAPMLASKSFQVSLQPLGFAEFSEAFEIPQGVKTLGVLASFSCSSDSMASDAVFVSIPVLQPLQTLTEAHSAVLRAGQDKDTLVASLRGLFVNFDASTLVPRERSIIDMIREALPDKVEPGSSNVLSLTESYWSNVLIRRLGGTGLGDSEMKDIMDKISACQNTGGGISWFDGMKSSPVVTAAVLQRIAAMPGEDTGAIDVAKAVKYLDEDYFSVSGRPYWCGGLSLGMYLQTRALFPEVPFEAPSGKVYKQFKKEVKEYLTPRKARGLNAQILAKARRLRTIQSLVLLPGGKELAKKWGIKVCRSLQKSLDADVESLLQYAVEHKSGGCYYPNAIMPWRGLLESELYAHSLLCDLLTSVSEQEGRPAYAGEASRIAEGIRLWLMIQKETQQWDTDAAYIESIASVLRGTPETLQTKVVLLSGSFTKPFPEVKASGNGFTVARKWTVDGRLLVEGDTLHVGDKVTASYEIWNEENRSFVRLSAPRPASMRPVQQLSGHYGWWLRPLSIAGWTFSPQGYRNVLSDKTEYWFDSYPEEKTTIVEEFFVTQEGCFQTPAVEIESLYAPHYRANDAGRGSVTSK